ncbi:MAG TPA: wax ester/triacylglycerol synthase family O-acyltransferase [Candidatus Solibacter sp.]|nr:wax ester/triacylglycerol synthase family O-acyltransferase [Candidatus Solibacter sp.]
MTTQRLSALDAAFLNFETPRQPFHVGALYIYKERPEVDGRPGVMGLFKTVEERLHMVPRYRQRIQEVPLALGHPVWVDDPDFDLGYHLRRLAVPRPGGMRELLDVVGRLHSRVLDRSRPLWEMYIIEGLSGGRVAVYHKTHHAMVDGIAAVDLALIIHDLDPASGDGVAPAEAFRPPPLRSPRELVGDAARELAGGLLGAAGLLPKAIRRAPRELASQALKATQLRELLGMLKPVPGGPLNVRVGGPRRVELASVSLDRFKAIKNRLGGTVNDVALAAMGEAIHTFLVSRGQAVPDDLKYRIMVPVSVRDDADKGPGNKVSAMFIDMPVGRMPARRRLEVVTHDMTGLKEARQSVAADQLLGLTSLAPPALHALAGHTPFTGQRFVNLVFSNVPGVQQPVYAGGALLLEAYPLLPVVANLGLVVCVASYNGGMYFGVVGDYAGLPDLDVVAGAIETGVENLERAAGLRPPKPVAHPAPAAAADATTRRKAARKRPKRAPKAPEPAGIVRLPAGAAPKRAVRSVPKRGSVRDAARAAATAASRQQRAGAVPLAARNG